MKPLMNIRWDRMDTSYYDVAAALAPGAIGFIIRPDGVPILVPSLESALYPGMEATSKDDVQLAKKVRGGGRKGAEKQANAKRDERDARKARLCMAFQAYRFAHPKHSIRQSCEKIGEREKLGDKQVRNILEKAGIVQKRSMIKNSMESPS